jgi:hypothetical protein
MLVYEQHIVLEAGVEMRLQTQLDDDRVVVAVDMCVDTVQTLEHVPDESWESFWERNADARGEHGLIVDVGLYPCHEVFDVFGCGHLGRLFVVFGVLPEVLKPVDVSFVHTNRLVKAYSSVAFISGQLCGEQNSVMEP